MRRLFLFSLLLFLLVACSENTNEPGTATPSEQKPDDVEVESDIGEADAKDDDGEMAFTNYEPVDGSEQVLDALQTLTNITEYKTTFHDAYNEHPDIDPFEKDVTLTYSEGEQFLAKMYKDNYFTANYESYMTSNASLYLKNEYGDETWAYNDGSFKFPVDLTVTVAQMLSTIVIDADSADIKDEGDNHSVVHVYMTNGDFETVAQQLDSLEDILISVGATDEVLEPFLDSTSEYEYNFTNIAADIYLNDKNELTSYTLYIDFNNDGQEGTITIEQSFNQANIEEEMEKLSIITAG